MRKFILFSLLELFACATPSTLPPQTGSYDKKDCIEVVAKLSDHEGLFGRYQICDSNRDGIVDSITHLYGNTPLSRTQIDGSGKVTYQETEISTPNDLKERIRRAQRLFDYEQRK